MTLYASKKALRAAIWREDVRPWLLARLDVFVTACIRALGYCAALVLLVWAVHHGLL